MHKQGTEFLWLEEIINFFIETKNNENWQYLSTPFQRKHPLWMAEIEAHWTCPTTRRLSHLEIREFTWFLEKWILTNSQNTDHGDIGDFGLATAVEAIVDPGNKWTYDQQGNTHIV